MKRKENRGGKRNGSGRKPLPADQKKEAITAYVLKALIKKLGGKWKAKLFIEEQLNKIGK